MAFRRSPVRSRSGPPTFAPGTAVRELRFGKPTFTRRLPAVAPQARRRARLAFLRATVGKPTLASGLRLVADFAADRERRLRSEPNPQWTSRQLLCSRPTNADQARRLSSSKPIRAEPTVRRPHARCERSPRGAQRRALRAHRSLPTLGPCGRRHVGRRTHRHPLRAVPEVRLGPRLRETTPRAVSCAPIGPRLHAAQRTKLRSGKSG